jgi:hypothetical protein
MISKSGLGISLPFVLLWLADRIRSALLHLVYGHVHDFCVRSRVTQAPTALRLSCRLDRRQGGGAREVGEMTMAKRAAPSNTPAKAERMTVTDGELNEKELDGVASPAIPKMAFRMRQINPTGKSLLFYRIASSQKFPIIENISLFQKSETRYTISIPSRSEGRIMIATNVGRVAVDAGSADNERHESVRQRRVVPTPDMLASSSWETSFSGATVARELRLTGESAL